jgi:predicted ATPase/DNA-binding SARP family transcriptional activator/tetratricopeptide (TPR) repeat protein
MELRVLGPIEALGDAGPVRLVAPMQRRLLAALVIGAGETCSGDALIDALWGASPPASAPKLLQVYVSQLRKVLPAPARIRTRGGGYALEFDDRSIDADRFERLLDEGREALGDGNPALAMSLLTKALDLWRGAAYADVAYEAFAYVEAERLEELRRVAIEERNDAGLALGRHKELLAELTSSARAHPLRERLQGQAMVALYRCGRQSDALEVYADVRTRLRDELGLEPGPELRELQRRILQHDPSLFVPPRGDEPLRLLPAAPNALLGRDRELGELRELLLRDDVRLVVLSGAGGAGKTRLALEAARRTASSFANGVAFVSLAPLRDPALVVGEISRALGVREAGTEPRAALLAALRTQELLLVLDNAEHLRAAAPLFVELVAAAPRLTLLVTSRVVLHLSGEHVYPVEPLEEDAATELFGERARDASPHFRSGDADEEAIRLICERLDGLPLAIELAASRTRALTPVELLARLDSRLPLLTGGPRDLPARQQTLRATLDWTVDLLDEDELHDLMHLAVFAGGCTLEAAEAVASTTVERLSALIDHSLMRQASTATGSRFSMLETIREYALELLDRSQRLEAVRAAHAEYYLALAEQLEPDFERGQRAALDRIETELDNFRAAFAWAQEADGELALRLAASLRTFWFPSAQLAEGRLWLAGALERPHSPSHDLAAVAAELGRIHALLGELEPAGERIAEALELAEALDLPDVLSGALNARYLVLQWSGRDADARSALERALAIARENNLHGPLLRALYNLSFEIGVGDRVVESRRINHEGLELARACADQGFEYRFISNLVEEDVWLGDWDAALRVAAECYSQHGRNVAVLSPLPWLFVQRGELGEARRTLEKLAPLAARDGLQPRSLEAVARAVVRRAEGRTREALAAAEEVLARRARLGGRHSWVKLAFEEAVEAAFALDDLDRVAELLDEWELRSSEQRTPYVEAHEQRFAARLAARRGEADAVEPSFLRATDIFRELSTPFYVAVALLERGEWLAEQGRGEDAEPLLVEARETFQRLKARPWLERASQSRVGQVGVP